MDFGIFGFSPEQVQEFRNFLATQQQQAQGQQAGGASQAQATAATATDNGNANGAAGVGGGDQQQPGGGNGDGLSGNNPNEPVLMHTSAHNGVVCDVCNTEIRGFRYKCMQCADFDLCGKCEHKGHHAGHVMMRISFPEQARDAIRKYLSNAGGSCPPSPPTPRGPLHGLHHGHGPHHGHGSRHHGPHHSAPEEFPSMRRGGRCHRKGSGLEEDAERPATATADGCPYTMGKKEFKKWSKWMKRAAIHQQRSAAAYARAAASGNGAGPSAEAQDAEGAPEGPPMDFAAVASQIQEFLNYWGIPVDVVELYDQFGNQGVPTTPGSAPSESASTRTATTATQQGEASAAATQTQETTAATATQDQQPGSLVAANLSENMQQMHINEPQSNANAAAPVAPRDMSLLMDLDDDKNDWTILENQSPQSREQSPGNSSIESEQPAAVASAPPAQTGNQASGPNSIGSNNGNGNTPFVSAGSSSPSPASGHAASAPPPPTSFPAGLPNVPLYPVLNTPQIQQILQGVSSADPRGPMGTTTTVTNSTPAQVPSTGVVGQGQTGSIPANVELDARSMKTLNQLLAMGFSNEGGYLTRLVLAKNGDLEAVLSSLFPN